MLALRLFKRMKTAGHKYDYILYILSNILYILYPTLYRYVRYLYVRSKARAVISRMDI